MSRYLILLLAVVLAGSTQLAADQPLDAQQPDVCLKVFARSLEERNQQRKDKPTDAFSLYLRYFDEYFEDLGSSFDATADWKLLVEQARRHKLILVGDIHDLAECRRAQMKLLTELAKDRRIILGLECVPIQSRQALDHFLAGKTDKQELAKQLQEYWWYFQDQNGLWPELLDFARQSKFRVEPLEDADLSANDLRLDGTTYRRDQAAAAKIRRLLKQGRQEEILVVIYGYYHILGKGHLRAVLDVPCLTITPYAPAQHFHHVEKQKSAVPILSLRRDLFYLPCMSDAKLAKDIEGNSAANLRQWFEGERAAQQWLRLRQQLWLNP